MSSLVKVSPTMAKLIRDMGLEGVYITPSGPKDTVTKPDIDAAAAAKVVVSARRCRRGGVTVTRSLHDLRRRRIRSSPSP
jgi:hypothetical protein